jgi:hypothetical protein
MHDTSIRFFIVAYVPEWFPGTAWKQYAKKGRKLAYEMVNLPFDMVTKAMVCTFLSFIYLPVV